MERVGTSGDAPFRGTRLNADVDVDEELRTTGMEMHGSELVSIFSCFMSGLVMSSRDGCLVEMEAVGDATGMTHVEMEMRLSRYGSSSSHWIGSDVSDGPFGMLKTWTGSMGPTELAGGTETKWIFGNNGPG